MPGSAKQVRRLSQQVSYKSRPIEDDICVDIYTGFSTRVGRDFWAPAQCHGDGVYNRFWDSYSYSPKIAVETVCSSPPETAEEVLTDLQSEMVSRMPLYELKALIDTLYLMTTRMPDLTERDETIPSAAGSLCLTANGGEVMLWTCDWREDQHWQYDRQSGVIFNPQLGACLEVSEGWPAMGNGWPAMGRGFPVGLDYCWAIEDNIYQRWTYDPETNVLLNAMGLVLTVGRIEENQWQSNVAKPGDLVGASPLLGQNAPWLKQQWLAVP